VFPSMPRLRPQATKVGHGFRLGLVLILLAAASGAIWFYVSLEITYTDGIPSGPPKPAVIHADYVVDKDVEKANISIEGYTAFKAWMQERKPVQDLTPDAESPEPGRDSDENWRLDTTRQVMFALMICLSATELLLLRYTSRWRLLRALLWFSCVLCMLVAVPVSIAYDMSDGGIQGVEDPEQSAFAHSDGEIDLNYRGLSLDLDFTWHGYDLGLVPAPNRSAVLASEPLPGDDDYESRIALEGSVHVDSGGALQYILFIPLVWFIFPTSRPDEPEGASTECE